jgi:hypothetical protein
MKRAYCAHTTNPNTPESDKLPKVLHDVTVKITVIDRAYEEVVRIMSQAPDTAIREINDMSDADYLALERVNYPQI